MTQAFSFKKALAFSLLLHLFLVFALLWLERPQKPRFQVVRLKLKSVSFSPAAPSPKTKTSKAASKVKSPKAAPKTKTPSKERRIKKVAKKRASPSRKLSPKKVAKPVRKTSQKAPAVKKKALESPPKEPTPGPNEEKLLAKRLAALRAQAEEKALREKLLRLKSSRKAKASGGLSLGTGVSQEFARRLMAHLKAFWAVPEVLEDREDLAAEVELKIAPDGHLLSYRFLRRSGEPLFDEAVVATLKKAEPLPAPGQTLTLSAVFKIR